MNPAQHIADCDHYLGERSGKYEWRCIRYDRAINAMLDLGISSDDTVCDVGAGWTEFGARMFTRLGPGGGHDIRPRYFPVDGGLDGTDLEVWTPPRTVDFFVALELLEHLSNPERLVNLMMERARTAIIISTPNPRTTDVLGMDRTHKVALSQEWLEFFGFAVEEVSFYGQEADSLFGVWTP